MDAGIIPVLVELFDSLDTDVLYYSISTLANIALDGKNIVLLSSSSLRLSRARCEQEGTHAERTKIGRNTCSVHG